MERLSLVKYLAESAAELIAKSEAGSGDRSACLDEAAELLHLGTRILSRDGAGGTETVIQEAA